MIPDNKKWRKIKPSHQKNQFQYCNCSYRDDLSALCFVCTMYTHTSPSSGRKQKIFVTTSYPRYKAGQASTGWSSSSPVCGQGVDDYGRQTNPLRDPIVKRLRCPLRAPLPVEWVSGWDMIDGASCHVVDSGKKYMCRREIFGPLTRLTS